MNRPSRLELLVDSCESVVCSFTDVLSVLHKWLLMLTFRNVFLFQSLPIQAQVANVLVPGSSASSGVAVDSSKSVIDLTDDDDTSAAAAAVTKPPVPAAQVFVIAPQHPASLPPPLALPSTAIVKPTVRPVPPPPLLQMAPNQQARLQVLSCNTSTSVKC